MHAKILCHSKSTLQATKLQSWASKEIDQAVTEDTDKQSEIDKSSSNNRCKHNGITIENELMRAVLTNNR